MSRDKCGRFQTGGKGGPGRPIGSRNRLAEDFLSQLSQDWTQHGTAVIAKVRKEYPVVYFRTLASLVPRELPLPVQNEFEHLSNDELANELIRAAAAVRGFSKQ
jgi:hypothetical protein